MMRVADSFAIWLGDFYLLSSLLLALALGAAAFLRQPAHRLAIAKATLVGVAILAALCALPRWSVVHLVTARERQSPPIQARTVQTVTTERIPFAPLSMPRDSVVAREATSAQPTIEMDAIRDSAVITWPLTLSAMYVVGAFGFAIWLGVGSLAVRRLRRSASEAPAELVALLSEVAARRAVSAKLPSSFGETRLRNIDLLVSNRIEVPVALGLVRPAILLPQTFTQSAIRNLGNPRGAEIVSVLTHELAHIHNRDLYWLAASRVLTMLLWAQPLFWLLKRRMRLEQESLADAAAAELTSRQRYAAQLVAWARSIGNRPAVRVTSAVGLWEGPSQLRQRIALLLNDRFSILRECSFRWRTSSFLACGVAALGLSLLTLQPGQSASQPTESAGVIPPDSHSVPNALAGRALDEAGQPIAKAEIFLFRVRHDGSQRRLIAQKTTGADGSFQFDNVINIEKEFPDQKFPPPNEPGDDFVEVVMKANGRASVGRILIPQVVAKVGEYQEFMLPKAAALKGRVTGPDGAPVRDAIVSIENGGVGPWDGASSSRTDAGGNYTITDAIPFDLGELEKQIDAAEAKRPAGVRPQVDELIASTPKLSVVHPDFAMLLTKLEKSPGKKDVQLAAAATLEGRVVFADGKPAAGAVVGLATSYMIKLGEQPTASEPKFYKAAAVADANGKYRISSLPAGKYDLWAEVPGWVNGGLDAVDAKLGAPTAVPDLVVIKGGLIRARLVDARTTATIRLDGGAKAQLTVEQLSRPAGRPVPNHVVTPNADGRFEIHAIPGKPLILFGGVEIGGSAKWYSEKPVVITAKDGQTSDVDVPVVDVAERAAAIQQDGNPPLPNAPLPPPPPPPADFIEGNPRTPKRPAATEAKELGDSKQAVSTPDDGPPEQGSQMLRDLRAKSAPLLAKMAEDHGYGLAAGKDVARVAPPFAPLRMEWYRVANPTQAEHIPRGPEAMLFRWSKGKLENWGMSFGDPANPGRSVLDLCDWILGVKPQDVEGPKSLLMKVTPGDWVVRTGVKKEALAEQLQTILQKECSVPVRLEFREVKRPVYVVSGEYGKITPPAGYKAQGTMIYTDKTITTDEIQIYGKELVTDSGSGGGTGHFDEFLSWLGQWIEAPIVSDVKNTPKNEISWNLHGRSPFTEEMRREDRDAKLVLANITKQTGLSFTLEKRPIKVLFVERAAQ